jgi:hypothetical protein
LNSRFRGADRCGAQEIFISSTRERKHHPFSALSWAARDFFSSLLEGLVRPETHWDRLRTAKDRLRDAGAEGAAELLSAPSGWVRLMEGLSEGLSALLEAEPGARLHLRQVKEKFGTLRVYASVEGSDAFRAATREVTDWATAASERRCALTGRPGLMNPEGWFLVLSPQATVWRRAEPDAFHRAIYPPRPRPEPEAPAP